MALTPYKIVHSIMSISLYYNGQPVLPMLWVGFQLQFVCEIEAIYLKNQQNFEHFWMGGIYNEWCYAGFSTIFSLILIAPTLVSCLNFSFVK